MSEAAIRHRLVERGEILLRAAREFKEFTRNTDADAFLNDLEAHPHAFVLACVMDRQIKAEKAWIIPYRIAKRLGTFSMQELVKLSREQVKDLMSKPERLHRFDKMSDLFHLAIQRIANQYSGDATRIWSGEPSSAEVVYRFLEFQGVGPKIATMAVNLLARIFKIPFADYFSIDISPDVHVRRVFSRLGFVPPDASIEQITYKARALHPAFPGIMDSPSWEIGRQWCNPQSPKCNGCYMNDLCPTAASQSTPTLR
jgi:endonuclease III